ncbi:MAG: ABC transporter ATP-binding protein [Candidatus Limnocylindrales bacterium]
MLRLQGVGARYGGATILDGIDLAVDDGALVSILGPSGAGKTTLLRIIAGLERPSSGSVVWDGTDLADVPVHERGFGLMFQDYALFPHRDVAGNVAFGLRMRGDTESAIRDRVAEALDLVGMAGTERRSIDRLSGGEQQRVALARAVAPKPRLLMLDEPLGSLDRELRQRLPLELRATFKALDATVLYVTHDQEEALGVADRTIILRDGRIEADGTPEALWHAPPTAFVARFLGFHNICAAIVRDGVGATPWGDVPVDPGTPDGTHDVVIRPDAFAPDEGGTIRGRVKERIFRGDHDRVRLAIDGAPPLEVDARWSPSPAIGEALVLRVDPAGVAVLPTGAMLRP